MPGLLVLQNVKLGPRMAQVNVNDCASQPAHIASKHQCENTPTPLSAAITMWNPQKAKTQPTIASSGGPSGIISGLPSRSHRCMSHSVSRLPAS
eukprot:1161909-Pelagomonas_calceolata.AAC.19